MSHTITVHDVHDVPPPPGDVVMGWVFSLSCWIRCYPGPAGWVSLEGAHVFKCGDGPTHWHALAPDVPDAWFQPPGVAGA